MANLNGIGQWDGAYEVKLLVFRFDMDDELDKAGVRRGSGATAVQCDGLARQWTRQALHVIFLWMPCQTRLLAPLHVTRLRCFANHLSSPFSNFKCAPKEGVQHIHLDLVIHACYMVLSIQVFIGTHTHTHARTDTPTSRLCKVSWYSLTLCWNVLNRCRTMFPASTFPTRTRRSMAVSRWFKRGCMMGQGGIVQEWWQDESAWSQHFCTTSLPTCSHLVACNGHKIAWLHKQNHWIRALVLKGKIALLTRSLSQFLSLSLSVSVACSCSIRQKSSVSLIKHQPMETKKNRNHRPIFIFHGSSSLLMDNGHWPLRSKWAALGRASAKLRELHSRKRKIRRWFVGDWAKNGECDVHYLCRFDGIRLWPTWTFGLWNVNA